MPMSGYKFAFPPPPRPRPAVRLEFAGNPGAGRGSVLATVLVVGWIGALVWLLNRALS